MVAQGYTADLAQKVNGKSNFLDASWDKLRDKLRTYGSKVVASTTIVTGGKAAGLIEQAYPIRRRNGHR